MKKRLTPAQVKARKLAGSRKGGRARAAQFTSESQKRARACLPREAMARGGAHSWRNQSWYSRATIRRLRGLAAYRRNHPSTLTQIVIGWLKGWGVRHFVEWLPAGGAGIAFDIAIPAYRAVIEVDGHYWHSGAGRGRWAGAAANEARKAEWVWCRDWHLIHLTESEIRNGRGYNRLFNILSDLAGRP